MSNQNLAVRTALNDPSFGGLSGMAKWQAKQEIGLATKQNMVAAVQEQGRALLANMALESVGALSSLEEHLCEIAPAGAHRYRMVVDAYAMGVAQRLAQW